MSLTILNRKNVIEIDRGDLIIVTPPHYSGTMLLFDKVGSTMFKNVVKFNGRMAFVFFDVLKFTFCSFDSYVPVFVNVSAGVNVIIDAIDPVSNVNETTFSTYKSTKFTYNFTRIG